MKAGRRDGKDADATCQLARGRSGTTCRSRGDNGRLGSRLKTALMCVLQGESVKFTADEPPGVTVTVFVCVA